MTRRPNDTPLAWQYICRRLDARRAFDRYQLAEARTLRAQASEIWRQAARAGGVEADTVREACRLIGDRRDLTDPGALLAMLPPLPVPTADIPPDPSAIRWQGVRARTAQQRQADRGGAA